MNDINEILADHPFSDGLDERIVQMVGGFAKSVSFSGGEYVFREGEGAENFYLIREGHVALEMFAPGKGPLTFMTLKGGDLLGVSWLVPPYCWAYDARAIEKTRAIAFNAKELRDQCEADHHVGYELLKRFISPLIQRLHSARVQSANVFHVGEDQ